MCLCSEAWLFTQPTMPEAGPEWKGCCFAGVTVTLWASVQHLGRCDGQVRPGKECFGRLDKQKNPLLHLVSLLRCGYGGISLKASLSLFILGSCETSAASQWPTTWLSVGNVKLQSMSFLHTTRVTFNRSQHRGGRLETIGQNLVLIFIVLVIFILLYGKLSLLMIPSVVKIEETKMSLSQ